MCCLIYDVVHGLDSSFSESVRELLKVKFFHAELFKKIFFAKSSAHYPLLKILRQLTRNGEPLVEKVSFLCENFPWFCKEQTAKILGREGVMSTIRKGLTILGSAPCGKVLIVLDMLNQLTKLSMWHITNYGCFVTLDRNSTNMLLLILHQRTTASDFKGQDLSWSWCRYFKTGSFGVEKAC